MVKRNEIVEPKQQRSPRACRPSADAALEGHPRRQWNRRVVANFWQISEFRQNFARFRLYRHRSLQENTRFAAFFIIYQILKLKFLKFGKFCRFCNICKNVAEFSRKLLIFQTDFLRKFWDCSGAKGCKSCRAWKMLSNAYFLAKFRSNTAENEPAKNLQNLLKNV